MLSLSLARGAIVPLHAAYLVGWHIGKEQKSPHNLRNGGSKNTRPEYSYRNRAFSGAPMGQESK